MKTSEGRITKKIKKDKEIEKRQKKKNDYDDGIGFL